MQPTHGLGDVVPRTDSASSMARRMCSVSLRFSVSTETSMADSSPGVGSAFTFYSNDTRTGSSFCRDLQGRDKAIVLSAQGRGGKTTRRDDRGRRHRCPPGRNSTTGVVRGGATGPAADPTPVTTPGGLIRARNWSLRTEHALGQAARILIRADHVA